MSVSGKDINIVTRDGLNLSATYFPSHTTTGDIALIGSALGVPRYYYSGFARYLTESGYSVLTFDYRGIFESAVPGISGSEMRMEDWGRQDIDAALSWIIEREGTGKRVYIAHSCGGQLVGLAPNSRHLDAMVFVASQLGYWKQWPLPYRFLIYMLWKSIPIFTPLFEYLPPWLLNISNLDLPSGVIRQWARWGMSANYLFDYISHDDRNRYRSLEVPLLAYGFTDDLLYAPPASIDALLEFYEGAEVERRQVDPGNLDIDKIGHFGFFRNAEITPLWDELIEWLHSR